MEVSQVNGLKPWVFWMYSSDVSEACPVPKLIMEATDSSPDPIRLPCLNLATEQDGGGDQVQGYGPGQSYSFKNPRGDMKACLYEQYGCSLIDSFILEVEETVEECTAIPDGKQAKSMRMVPKIQPCFIPLSTKEKEILLEAEKVIANNLKYLDVFKMVLEDVEEAQNLAAAAGVSKGDDEKDNEEEIELGDLQK